MRRVLNDGSDPSKPMDIDFMVACPSIESAELIAPETEAKGYKSSIFIDEDSGAITCYCMKSMLLDYDLLISAQAELDAVARSHEGYIDGWGTFGNAPDPKP
jgi:regulator of RNase E activity RraB